VNMLCMAIFRPFKAYREFKAMMYLRDNISAHLDSIWGIACTSDARDSDIHKRLYRAIDAIWKPYLKIQRGERL